MGNIVKSSASPAQTSPLPLDVAAALPSTETATLCLLVLLDELTRETLNGDVRQLAILNARERCKGLPDADQVFKVYSTWAEAVVRRNPLSGMF